MSWLARMGRFSAPMIERALDDTFWPLAGASSGTRTPMSNNARRRAARALWMVST